MSHDAQRIELPADLESWLDDYATERDRTFESALSRAVMAFRLIEEGDPRGELDDRLDELLDRLATIETRVDAIETDRHAAPPAGDAEIEAVESRLTEEIEDTRSRIIDVLREAKSKADDDHSHPELAEAAHDHPAIGEQIAALESTIDALEAELASGFDNYETILEAHDEAVVDLEAEVETVGEAIDSLGTRLAAIEQAQATREQAAELKAEANRKNVTQGRCEQCRESVTVSLLDTPQCPHCASWFDGVDPGMRFVGRATIETADRPAIESGPEPSEDKPSSEEESNDQ